MYSIDLPDVLLITDSLWSLDEEVKEDHNFIFL